MAIPLAITTGSNHIAYGERTFTTTGLNTWTVPVGVTSISAVCIGGGGGGGTGGGAGGGGALAYVNNAVVTSGDTLSIYVGAGGASAVNGGISSVRTSAGTTLVSAGGGVNGDGTRAGGTVLTGTGFAGGAGGAVGSSRPGGGGGAGGYGAAGGLGGTGVSGGANGTAGTGGSGGGGWGSSAGGTNGGQGGGVAVGYGSCKSGSGGSVTGNDPNSYGSTLVNSTGTDVYGGGGGGISVAGANGVVKIVWNVPSFGPVRTFPSTNVVNTTDFVGYFISTTISTTNTITIPNFTVANDIAFLFDSASNASTTIPTSVTPSGWTSILSSSVSSTSSGRTNVSYKQLVAGDANTSITGMNGGTNRKILIIVRPTQPTLSTNSLTFTLSTPGSQATTGANPSNQTISMSTLNTSKDQVILYFANYHTDSGITITRGLTGAAYDEHTSGSGHFMRFGDFRASETPTNATVSMSATGPAFQILTSFYMILDQT